MKRMLKIYMKLFLSYGLIFGFLMSLWDYFDEGNFNLLRTLFMIIFFGGFMAWISVESMKKSKKKFGGEELTDEDFNASQVEIVSKTKSVKEIYDLLKTNESTKNWKLNFDEFKITGRTKLSWVSWGERITISDMKDKIKIESRLLLRTTLFDNGANKGNVSLLKILIEK